MPPATLEIFERESKDFLADVELFLEAECGDVSRRRRSASRCRSGVRCEDDHEPLARAEPVEIDLGEGLTFRIAGRIDRIDQVGAGVVRGDRLQDRRLLARRLEGHVQRRPSSAARALRPRRGRAAARHATRSRRSPRASTTSRATRAARSA